jgi:1,4-alpha-glucan branching enzyme
MTPHTPSPRRERPALGPGTRLVRFELHHPGARTVHLAGTFNDWRPQATVLFRGAAGWWTRAIILPPGEHHYLYVVDGVWLPDPAADVTVPNPYGGVNSVVFIS